MNHLAIIKFDEISLKGKNQPLFINQLVNNLDRRLKNNGDFLIVRRRLFLEVEYSKKESWKEIKQTLSQTFGIAKFYKAFKFSKNIDTVKPFLLSFLEGKSIESFRIKTKRSDKSFPKTSWEIDRILGEVVHSHLKIPIILKNPELTIYVEITTNEILVHFQEFSGLGGLPTGISGRVLALISGGIDSPVAAWQIMKRGCSITFLHFHSYPLTNNSSIEKVREIVGLLQSFHGKSKLILVPFSEIQKCIITNAPTAYRILLYRRYMFKIAQKIALKEKALALLTGESLGQVSSQTIQNITAISAGTKLPILRPLIGYNKPEIISIAKSIGTFNTSIEPDQDCCSLFVPKRPVLFAKTTEVSELEKKLPIKNIFKNTLANIESLVISKEKR